MELKCKYYDCNYGYTCEVQAILKNPSLSSAILITGQQLPGKSIADVQFFKIINHPLDVFPRNLQENLPNLTHLWINDCGLKKISRTDLIGLENLESLNLSGNDLISLPDDLLADMKKLQTVSFNNNKLERLSSKLLKPIEKSLKWAFFSKNTKINDYFNKNDANRSLKRLMDIMDSLEPPLPKTGSFPDEITNTDQKHHQQLTTKFAEFKASGNFTDFTIKVGEKEFKVHKAILASQSPVFEQMFLVDDGTTKKTFTKVRNDEFTESFGNFLDFFYSGKVGNEVNALVVFELATIFEVAILKEVCCDKITATLSEENALEVYNLGHHHDSEQLKRNAFKVIQKLIPKLSDKMMDNRDHVNKLVTAKREYEAMLEATEKL